jgi:hypothetical protein
MRNLLTLANIAGAMAALALMAACQTTGSGPAVAQKETLLARSGFKVVTVKTPKQQQAVNGLAQGRCSAVKYNGKLYYVFPTATKDRIYVGKQAQFNAYKKAVAAQQTAAAAQQASWNAQQQQQMLHGGSPYMAGETAGPNHIEVEEFQGAGFAPFDDMGD